MRVLKQPRFWLVAWGGLGAAFILYVIIASSVQRGGQSQETAGFQYDQSLLTGHMEAFRYALPPRKAPPDRFERDDRTVSLADFRGKAVLVNFWATWCTPCLRELPSLDALQAAHGGDDFEVIAVAADPGGREAAKAFYDRLKIANLDLYSDPNLSFAAAIGAVDVLPVTVLYDRRGREIGRLVGDADWASDEATALIRAAMR